MAKYLVDRMPVKIGWGNFKFGDRPGQFEVEPLRGRRRRVASLVSLFRLPPPPPVTAGEMGTLIYKVHRYVPL